MKIKFNKNGTLKKQCIDIIKSDIKQNINNMNYYDFRIYCVNNDMVLKDGDFSTLQSFFDEQKLIAINDKLSQNRMIVSELTYRDELYLRNVEMCDDEINDILLKVDKSPQDYKNLESLSRTRSRFYSDHEKISKQIAIMDLEVDTVETKYKERFKNHMDLWK